MFIHVNIVDTVDIMLPSMPPLNTLTAPLKIK